MHRLGRWKTTIMQQGRKARCHNKGDFEKYKHDYTQQCCLQSKCKVTGDVAVSEVRKINVIGTKAQNLASIQFLGAASSFLFIRSLQSQEWI